MRHELAQFQGYVKQIQEAAKKFPFVNVFAEHWFNLTLITIEISTNQQNEFHPKNEDVFNGTICVHSEPALGNFTLYHNQIGIPYDYDKNCSIISLNEIVDKLCKSLQTEVPRSEI